MNTPLPRPMPQPVHQALTHALGAATLGAALLLAPVAALAQSGHGSHGSHGAAATATAAKESGFVDAEVRRVDADRQRVTLRHGEIAALEMPPMTMVFAVADASWLGTLKAGDRVQVKITQRGSTYTVAALRPAP